MKRNSIPIANATFTRHERDLRRVLRNLIARSDAMIEAIDLSTDRFATETAQLSAATSAAEKVLAAAKAKRDSQDRPNSAPNSTAISTIPQGSEQPQ